MLRRGVSLFCLGVMFTLSVGVSAEVVGDPEKGQPNVLVLISDLAPKDEDDSLLSYYWSVPGRLPNFAAFLYSQTPLECGVVSDVDWRRKPVVALSLADHFRKAGYHTAFFGEWRLGSTPPYDPASRGFDSVWLSSGGKKKILTDMLIPSSEQQETRSQVMESMPKDKPWFCMVRASDGGGDARVIFEEVVAKAQTEAMSDQGTIILTLGRESAQVVAADGYSGKLPQVSQRSIGELSSELLRLIGVDENQKSPYLFYHQGSWPLTDSPEKYRHRGSLVMGEKFALADGLRLYSLTDRMTPDKNNPLDLSTHAATHQQGLKAHGQWWKKASVAIHHPRPFDVGMEGQRVVTLTALDWRPTKIIHKDGSALASEPMVYQDTLLAILRGVRDNEVYKQSFPAYSGSWSLNITRSGRYRITARLLPKVGVGAGDQDLAKLDGGEAHIKLGRNEVQLKLTKGATSVSVLTDADAGVTDLECWFVGQLALERELGAFFVDIERVDDKKFDFDLKTKPQEK